MEPHLRQSDRAFGLMFAAVFAAIAIGIFFIFNVVVMWAILTSGIFLVLAIFLPWTLLPLNRLWSAFAAQLGHINNHVLLGAFYYVIVTPMGLILRLFRDPMHRKIDLNTASYWSPVRRKAEAETYRDLF
jgi:hypothetical protein